MAGDSDSKTSCDSGLNRREFLILGGVGIAGTVAAQGLPGPAAADAGAKAPGAAGAYPVVNVVPLASIQPGAQVSFNYPDKESPALLLALPKPAQGGVGPDNQFVAFSILCTHKGCPVNYLAERGMLVCPCHWSSFDPAKGGQIIIGQASQSLPQIKLRVQDGMVQAVGVDGLIYGRYTNIL
jgi:arsenite oxidase small subunit